MSVVTRSISVPSEDKAKNRLTFTLWTVIRDRLFRPLGSLKITCLLMAISMFLIFAGSLAQARRDVWSVVHEYFRTWIAWVQVKDLFPPSMFPSMIDKDWSELSFEQFPYPGGWLIGILMFINLVAAHLYRIRLSAKGFRLAFGSVFLVIAIAVVALIVVSGNTMQLQSQPLLEYDSIWNLVLGSLALVSAGSLALFMGPFAVSGKAKWLWAASALVTGGTFAYYFFGGNEARLTNESMRILWQLIQGSIAAIALLIGCHLLFAKRAGIVVLHLGIVMLMLSELQVGMYGRENSLVLVEGQASEFMRDARERELAIIRVDNASSPDAAATSSKTVDSRQVWVVPEHALRAAEEHETIIDDPLLPFDLRIPRFVTNCVLRPGNDTDENAANAGLGAVAFAQEMPPVSGVSEQRDISAVYVEVIPRTGDRTTATYLVAQETSEVRGEFAERIEVEGITFDLFLRSMRTYRPWQVKLLDVSRTNYIGTDTPKDFRSTLLITDKLGNEHEYTTWMNNPVRFSGETFYQQGYQQLSNGKEVTTLQVVRNTGWMLPYVGCMVVAFGVLAQFGGGLVRFLNRQTRIPAASSANDQAADTSHDVETEGQARADSRGWTALVVPVLIVGCLAYWISNKATMPEPQPGEMHFSQFERIPIAAGGRTLPFGSFARNSLKSMFGKATFEGELEPKELDAAREEITELAKRIWPTAAWDTTADTQGDYSHWITTIADIAGVEVAQAEQLMRPTMTTKRPAIRWMLDVIARPEIARRHRVFRIVDDQMLALLDLEKRPGFAYSHSEIDTKLSELTHIFKQARELIDDDATERMTPLQRRVHTLFSDISRVRSHQFLFNRLPVPNDDPIATIVETWGLLRHLESLSPALAVPTGSEQAGTAWTTLVASDAIVKSQGAFERLHISDSASAFEKLSVYFPQEQVRHRLRMTIEAMSAAEREQDATLNATEIATRIRQRASLADDEKEGTDDEEVRRIMALISDSKVTPSIDESIDAIVSKLTVDELHGLGGDVPSPTATDIIKALNNENDPRARSLRNRIHVASARGENTAEMFNEVAVKALVSDLENSAGTLLFGQRESQSTLTDASRLLSKALSAWKSQDPPAFNTVTADYHNWLESANLPLVDIKTIDYESFINRFAPQYYTIFLYLAALILTFFSWIGLRKPLWRSAMGVTILAFIVHTFFLIARMQISGRPPVTNLYSSAVFIGWAVVLGGLLVESVSRLGILTTISCASGAASLCIAYFLGIEEGDTLSVMQAVLDTQFWLATHVVCITIGYAATFLAGMLSIAYFGYRMFAARNPASEIKLKLFGSIIYGTVCFALLFSFVGTVLGGLWADDSWGRFWGWDPKENGALLIVIWNALILHARWDKFIRDYGTAVLAIGGNIVTAWSWFGVNELGAGLHNYGFTEGRLLYLFWFVIANLSIILVALFTVMLKRTAKV